MSGNKVSLRRGKGILRVLRAKVKITALFKNLIKKTVQITLKVRTIENCSTNWDFSFVLFCSDLYLVVCLCVCERRVWKEGRIERTNERTDERTNGRKDKWKKNRKDKKSQKRALLTFEEEFLEIEIASHREELRFFFFHLFIHLF